MNKRFANGINFMPALASILILLGLYFTSYYTLIELFGSIRVLHSI